MAKYYAINFNSSLYLTSDGTVSGKPCKLSVTGIEAVLLAKTGFTAIAIDGTPVTQLIEQNGKGKVIEITVNTLLKSVFDSIKTLVTNSLTNSTTIALNGTGDAGNFAVNVIPLMPNPFNFQGFRNDYIQGVTLRFVTT